jgi:hypothetical protein
MSGKKPLTNGSPILNFQQISSQNLSSLFVFFAENEETGLVHTEKDPCYFFLLHDTFYDDCGSDRYQ